MKKITFFLAVLIFPISVFAANAVVINTAGDTQYLKSNEVNWLPVTKGLYLTENDEIKTGSGGTISLILDTGSKIDIGSLTKVKIAKLTDTDTLLDLTMGELESRVEKMKKNMSFKVKTPASVCAVRGTRFKVVVERTGRTRVTVFAGIVSAREISGIGEEIYIRSNQYLDVLPGVAPSGAVDLSFIPTAREVLLTKAEVMNEVRMDMTKEQVQAASAIEVKNAEYELGKTMVDYFGKRVRIEEYIVRPRTDQFKFVALNERDNRFDYFTWLATFNTDLPADMSEANQIAFAGSWTSMPDYYIETHECLASNTVDNIIWTKAGSVSGGSAGYTYNEDVTSWKINGVDALANMGGITEDKTSLLAYDKYSTSITGIGNYSEEYRFIDDEGNLANRSDYEADPLSYNEEFVFTGENFKGVEGKIDIVVEPKIFEQAGIR